MDSPAGDSRGRELVCQHLLFGSNLLRGMFALTWDAGEKRGRGHASATLGVGQIRETGTGSGS
jgi:hypothetical protein